MVKFYDENYKEVYLPGDSRLHYGSIPLELTISSIQMEKASRKSKPVGRTASLRGAIIASDDIDMDMKMDNVMTFLRRLGEFYVAKANTPFKLLKVEVLDSYDIEPGNGVLTEFVVPLNVLKPFYKQSLHTTGTIGSEGMLFNNKWAYGMGTWFAENYWQYEFLEGVPYNENLLGDSDESHTNSNVNIANYPIKEEINVGEKVTVTIYGELADGRNAFALYNTSANSDDYLVGRVSPEDFNDELGAYVATFPWSIGANTELRVMQRPSSVTSSSTITKIKLERGNVATDVNGGGQESKRHKITFFNAGTENVKFIQQKYSTIKVDIKSSAQWFEISDGTNTFRLNKNVKYGDTLTIKGSEIRLNGNIVLGETNATFLAAKSGINNWEVFNLNHFKISFDFRFLYD